MSLKCGTRIAISNSFCDHVGGVGASYWLDGRIGSRTTNGWLKVRIRGRKDLVVIRNNPRFIVKWQEPRVPDPAITTIARFARGMLARIEFRNLMQIGKIKDEALELLDKATKASLNAYWDEIVQETITASKQTKCEDNIDSLSESDDEIEIVDPPDDAYGNLTTEQQKVIRRLIGEFTKMNKSTGDI
mgnify:CR=1 FL=1|jgi:hypothetical protein